MAGSREADRVGYGCDTGVTMELMECSHDGTWTRSGHKHGGKGAVGCMEDVCMPVVMLGWRHSSQPPVFFFFFFCGLLCLFFHSFRLSISASLCQGVWMLPSWVTVVIAHCGLALCDCIVFYWHGFVTLCWLHVHRVSE